MEAILIFFFFFLFIQKFFPKLIRLIFRKYIFRLITGNIIYFIFINILLQPLLCNFNQRFKITISESYSRFLSFLKTSLFSLLFNRRFLAKVLYLLFSDTLYDLSFRTSKGSGDYILVYILLFFLIDSKFCKIYYL